MANAEDIRPFIALPIPNLKALTPTTNKEDRLRTIISNLDQQQEAVRLSIIGGFKERLAKATKPDPDAMDIDSSHGRPGQPANDGMESLFTSLNCPYHDSMGDVSVKGDALLPQPPPAMRQATPPLEIQYAKEATESIKFYDRTVAKPARQHYVDALQRLQRRTSTGDSYAIKGAAEARSRDPPSKVIASPREKMNPLDPRRR